MSEFKQWSFGLSLSAEALGLTALQWEQYRIKNNVKVEGDMLDCDIEPRPLSYSLRDYHNAPSGEGPQAYQWKDKPHRLLYDLIAAVRYYAELAKLSTSATGGAKCNPASTECSLCKNDFQKCQMGKRWHCVRLLTSASGNTKPKSSRKSKSSNITRLKKSSSLPILENTISNIRSEMPRSS